MSINKYPLRFAHSEGHTDLCYTEDGSQIITCGNDGDIRIFAGIKDTDAESYCVGESAFSVTQKGEEVFVCRDDGRVMTLKIPEFERTGTFTRFSGIPTHIVASKTTSLIACGSEDFSIKVFKDSKDVECTIFSNLKGPVLGVEISPNGQFLAASSGDGNIYIWNLPEKNLLKTINCIPKCNSFTSAKILGRVSFDPESKLLAYPNNDNVTVINVENFQTQFTLSTVQVKAAYSIVQFSPCGLYLAASTSLGDICIWNYKCEDDVVVTSHEQKYNICALTWNPVEKGEISFSDNNGQIGMLEYKPAHENASITNDQLSQIGVADDEDEDDENVISLEKLKNETLGLIPKSPAAESSKASSRAASPTRPESPSRYLQPPFQPGSTPTHLSQRYMVFNDIGIVRLYTDEDDLSTSIDVQFHNATLFKNIYMKNHLNHSMASLSSSVLALACEIPSKLVCLPLKSGAKEWTVELADLEEILSVTASSNLVAIATNVRMLRLFSPFGIQRGILSIPGPVVTLASYFNYVVVVYHACTNIVKDQNLAAMLVNVDGFNISSKIIPIAITPQSFLRWVGFTDLGSLATYDSAGYLRVSKLNFGAWIPIFDSNVHTKGASDSYFLINVEEKKQTVYVIHCKGSVYPAAVPLPILTELPFQTVFCDTDTDKTQFEDKLFRMTVFATDQSEKVFKEAAIKLFALSCKNNMDDRAYELLEILNVPQIINLALKYSNKMGKTRMVEKLTELLRSIQNEDIENENEENAPAIPTVPRRINSRKELNQIQEVQQTQDDHSQELFSNSTILFDSQEKDLLVTPKPKPINPFVKPKVDKPSILNLNPEDFNTPISTASKTENDKTNSKTDKIEKDTFIEWFKVQKPLLQSENPELTGEEIVKLGLNLFKKSVAEKRKATDDSNSPKPKQQKLSAFAFKKH